MSARRSSKFHGNHPADEIGPAPGGNRFHASGSGILRPRDAFAYADGRGSRVVIVAVHVCGSPAVLPRSPGASRSEGRS